MMDAGLGFAFNFCQKLQCVSVTIGLMSSPSTADDEVTTNTQRWQNYCMWEPLMRALLSAPQTLSKISLRFPLLLHLVDHAPSILPSLRELNWDLLERVVDGHRNLESVVILLPPSLSALDAARNEIRQRLGRQSVDLVEILTDRHSTVC